MTKTLPIIILAGLVLALAAAIANPHHVHSHDNGKTWHAH